MFLSVIIPTYNRLKILKKCIQALENQDFDPDLITGYEIIVVDDGSTDETVSWLNAQKASLPHVRLLCQNHLGPAAARNLGVVNAKGDWIVFIDSDLVVTPSFLQSHAQTLLSAQKKLGHDRIFTYGLVINTCNFDNPTSEPFKITDFSAAYFATGNVAIAKKWLIQAGLFDTSFREYGWEDLELGVRLKKLGLKLIKCPSAVGYHWHPPFTLQQIPRLIEKEKQRGKMAVLFYQKHPTLEVRLMIQMTWFHLLLWGFLSFGGLLNENTLKPLLQWLIHIGKPQLALEIARIFLNWYQVCEVYRNYKIIQVKH
ncbi:MAG: glycosyltransferase [Geminocystis sp.]|nr:glycosyltransferase [Geminocystis sp.]HIK37473.1 glycosyltransferase [Geminocystis sp. M7585_C2015_104]MCS7147665.1 glycosyltransferase [Geminocystis sp.]MCX8078492.1 glycosyltransferase [Geminocystis sp.]MDW8117219.1 glycosyltransferase [Geminocystis sp.]